MDHLVLTEQFARHVKWANIQMIRGRVIVNHVVLVAGQIVLDKQAVFYAIKVHFLIRQGQQRVQAVELLQDFLLNKDLLHAYQGKLRAMRDIT